MLFVFLLAGWTACSQHAPLQPVEKPIEGLWGGKWDDTWPVFIEIHAGNNPGEYKIDYRWLENPGEPLSHQERLGHKAGNHIESGSLIFMIDDHGGLLYGAFENPRMANLVRITPNTVKVEDIVLENYGWTPGATPAGEALEKIKANDPH